LLYAVLVGRVAWTRSDWRRIAIGAALFALALPSAWLVLYAVSGVSVFELLNTALAIHYGLGEEYAPWLFFFPMDLFLFGGLVLAFLSLIEAVRAVAGVIHEPRHAHPEAVLPLTLWIAVLVLDISGLVRGEVSRLLLWLMPLFVIVAARAVALPGSEDDGHQRQKVQTGEAIVGFGLGVQLIVMVAFLRVIGTELAPAPFNPGLVSAVSPDVYLKYPAGVRFDAPPGVDGSAELVGFDAFPNQAGGQLHLTLVWHGVSRFDHPYFVSAVVDATAHRRRV
jgi:hypothetical protein